MKQILKIKRRGVTKDMRKGRMTLGLVVVMALLLAFTGAAIGADPEPIKLRGRALLRWEPTTMNTR